MWQALLISIWQLSAILLLTSSPLKLCQVGWGRCTFSGFSRNISLGSSSGSGWATQGHSQSCLYLTLAVCIGSLSCWKANRLPSLRFWMLWTRFSLRLSQYFGALRFSSTLMSLSVTAAEKQPHSMRLLPGHLTFGMVLCRWWAELVSFKHDVWNWDSSDHRILFLRVWGSFRCFFAHSKCVSCVLPEERIESCHTAIKPRSVECCSDVCPSVDFSHLHILYDHGAQVEWPSGSWSPH